MDAIYELKEMLCEELEEYGKKDKLDVGGLEIVDKLAHTVKNLDKIIETYEEQGYSSDYDNMDGSYDGSYGRRYSRERGYSRARGRNARRDSMGRYSRDGKMMARELRELMEDAPDESIKTEMRRLIQKVESM
jgi:hypothetical protein